MPFPTAAMFPLATARVLAMHRASVRGGDVGPEHPVMQAMIAARRRVRAFYERYYTILKSDIRNPKSEAEGGVA